MAWVLGHRQTKGAATDIPSLQPPRHTSTLPQVNVHTLALQRVIRQFLPCVRRPASSDIAAAKRTMVHARLRADSVNGPMGDGLETAYARRLRACVVAIL